MVLRKRYWRTADARAVIGAWERSKLTLSAFAAEQGLRPGRITRWVAKLKGRPLTRRPVAFHPVRMVCEGEPSVRAAVEIVLVDGRRVRVGSGFAAEDLARALAVLEARRAC